MTCYFWYMSRVSYIFYCYRLQHFMACSTSVTFYFQNCILSSVVVIITIIMLFFRWSTWHVLPLLFFIVFAYLTKTLHLGSLVSFVSLDPPDSWLSPGNKHQVSYWYLYYLLHKNWCDENNLLFNNINNADYQSVHMLKCRQWSTLWFIFYCC